MEIVETHCHLNNEQYISDLPAVLERARTIGVIQFMNVGWDLPSSEKAVQQAELFPDMKAVIGIHPHDASTASDEALTQLEALAANDKVAAWGEIGLDYYYDNSPRDIQRQAFRRQMAIAQQLDLPIVIHSREATQDTLAVLKEFAPLHGVMHCFSGSWETAEICIDMGLYIGFAGPITFKNARRLREVVTNVPLERIVVETDCPYLSPEPVRGRRNEPANLSHILAKLANLKQREMEEVAQITTVNAKNVFRLLNRL
ncbi:MAG: TatD family hydrolase [Firmicutes bacterium]|nr:TatD family hydrolase [Bacillota bacterium]